MQPNFQVSGSRTKLYSASTHSKQGSAVPSAKTSKLISLLKVSTSSAEEEITLLDSFIAEHKEQKEFKHQYYRTLFYHTLEHRLCQNEWLASASPLHILRIFQCARLLAREPSLLDLFAENDRVLQLVHTFVSYGKVSLNPEGPLPRLDKDSPLSFYDDVLVEILSIAKKILMNMDLGAESPKKSAIMGNGLRQAAGKKMLENKDFVETLKLLTRTKHPLLLQCVLETLAVIPSLGLLPESVSDVFFIEALLQALEDYDEEYKIRVAWILSQLLDKVTMQQIFQRYNGTQVTIEQLRKAKQKETKFAELGILVKASKIKEQLEVCKELKLWEILEEYVATDLDPRILVLSLATLSNLCFDDESCYQIRFRCAYSVCQLLMRHVPKLHPSIKGQYNKDSTLDKNARNEILLNCIKCLRHMYSLERNRKAMKLLFTPSIFGAFIDSGNYNGDPNAYIPILKKLNKLPDTELSEIQNNIEQLKLMDDEDGMPMDRIGRREFAGYQIIEPIGKGAFGSVYAVQKGGTKYAMKEISLTFFDSTTRSIRGDVGDFICREVAILKELDHPNIIKYYNSFQQGEYLYIVMELIEGMTIADYIASVSEKKQKLTEEEVWEVFIQLCEALRYLHVDRHVVHRDIAPTNIMISRKGTVKLADFGLAKDWGQQSGMLKSFVGTVVYSCPEIVQNMPYTSKADIWSLGCVIYELINLRPAFAAMNPLTLAKKIVDEDYEPLDDRGYSTHLVKVIKCCMTANPDKRPNIEEVAALMGPKLVTYIDKLRIKEESLGQMCNTLKAQLEKHESKGDASFTHQGEEETKVVKIDAKDLKKTVDPVSKILDTMHMILHIDYASPEIGDPHQRALVHTLARKVLRQRRNPTAIKAEIVKIIENSKNIVEGLPEKITYEQLGLMLEKLARASGYYS